MQRMFTLSYFGPKKHYCLKKLRLSFNLVVKMTFLQFIFHYFRAVEKSGFESLPKVCNYFDHIWRVCYSCQTKRKSGEKGGSWVMIFLWVWRLFTKMYVKTFQESLWKDFFGGEMWTVKQKMKLQRPCQFNL